MKTPEEYLCEQIFSPDSTGLEEQFTPEERAFLQRYMGLELEENAGPQDLDKRNDGFLPAEAALRPAAASVEGEGVTTSVRLEEEHPPGEIGIDFKSEIDVPATPEPARALSREDREARLKSLRELQFVSFSLFGQSYALPIDEVQEVIRYVRPTTIPTAPKFIAGMINLRGRVTPLVQMDALIHAKGQGPDPSDRFIVICRAAGLQVGLIIHSLSTMYRIAQDEIDWNIEALLGVASELLCGLFKQGDQIIGIVAIDRVVERVLKG